MVVLELLACSPQHEIYVSSRPDGRVRAEHEPIGEWCDSGCELPLVLMAFRDGKPFPLSLHLEERVSNVLSSLGNAHAWLAPDSMNRKIIGVREPRSSDSGKARD